MQLKILIKSSIWISSNSYLKLKLPSKKIFGFA